MKKQKVIIFTIVLGIIIILISILFNEQAEYESGMFVNGEKISSHNFIIKEDEDYFLEYDLIVENEIIDSFNDKKEKYIEIFFEDKLYEINYNQNSNTFRIKNDKIFLNINYIENKTNYNIEVFEDGKILCLETKPTKGKTLNKTKLRENKNIKSKLIIELDEKEELIVYDISDDWALVRNNQYVGYIEIENLKISNNTKSYIYNELSNNKNIVMAWDLFSREPNNITNFKYYYGLNVIAPTWHSLNKESIFTDWAFKDYINFYNNKHVEVWGVFNNSFDRDLTSEYIRNRNKRKEMIEEIIRISKNNNYDGINLDFENLHYEDREYLTLFIKELYIETREHDLIFSVDITAVSQSQNWSLIYDRKEIGKYSDYVVLMAYDETTNPEQGIKSIASLSWVENSIIELKDIINSNNIILGVPFYTRLWEITESDNEIYKDSTALKLETAENFIKDNNMIIIYDEESKQNYTETKIGNTTYKIWIEDRISLKERINLIKKYKIKGLAIWAFDYSTYEMWEEINRSYIKNFSN